jgi:hypothetical protein
MQIRSTPRPAATGRSQPKTSTHLTLFQQSPANLRPTATTVPKTKQYDIVLM